MQWHFAGAALLGLLGIELLQNLYRAFDMVSLLLYTYDKSQWVLEEHSFYGEGQ